MEQRRRQSRKRTAILDVICGTDTHPSAEWIYEQLKGEYPDLSLGTVYRNLAFFRENGCIRSVTVVDGVERYDANVLPHPHFVCRVCGGVYDIVSDTEILSPPSLERNGFHVESCDITYTGVCSDCSSTKKVSN